MPHLNFHPAPGFGDLLPGNFVVPQNPIRDAGTAMVPSVQAANAGQVARIPHLGELMPGMFVVPQNPVRDAMMSTDVTRPVAGAGQSATMASAAAGMHGLGCGSGGCGQPVGMGDLNIDQTISDITSTLTKPYGIGSFQVPLWGLLAAGAAALFLLTPGGSDYREERAALRSKHRGYRRAARFASRYSE